MQVVKEKSKAFGQKKAAVQEEESTAAYGSKASFLAEQWSCSGFHFGTAVQYPWLLRI